MRASTTRLPRAVFLLACAALLTAGIEAQGRIAWRYRVDAGYVPVRPAVGPDGTVYAIDTASNLHAIRPDGTARWVQSGAGNNGVDVAPDGTIYAADNRHIVAVRPDGSVRWTFSITPSAFILLGPSVGPDGNIYAIAEDSLGILSLTPAGALRWSTPERYSRPIVSHQELVFGPGSGGRDLQMYFHANGHFARVDCADGTMTVVDNGSRSQPAVGPNGDVYVCIANSLRSYAPDGSRNWTFGDVPRNVMSNAAAGPDGVVYVVRNVSYLHALRPGDGSSMWMHTDFTILQDPVVTPDNDTVLMTGRVNASNGFVRAVSTRGRVRWQLDLPQDGGNDVVALTRIRLAPDGTTAWFGAMKLGSPAAHYVYSIRIAEPRAGWSNYGSGWPGTLGVPAITSSRAPVLGRDITIRVDNSLGADTGGLLAVGTAPAARDVGLGGTLLVEPVFSMPLQIPRAGLGVPVTVPRNPALSGTSFYLQAIELDGGASHGVSFTPGLKLTLGAR